MAVDGWTTSFSGTVTVRPAQVKGPVPPHARLPPEFSNTQNESLLVSMSVGAITSPGLAA
ncbi:hypothetical protein [Lysobacter gummosus]|uniref:hypothetical protein n=1 Tax=Lysobacter gummosus TaxID=262324 RepID=UPI00363A8365